MKTSQAALPTRPIATPSLARSRIAHRSRPPASRIHTTRRRRSRYLSATLVSEEEVSRRCRLVGRKRESGRRQRARAPRMSVRAAVSSPPTRRHGHAATQEVPPRPRLAGQREEMRPAAVVVATPASRHICYSRPHKQVLAVSVSPRHVLAVFIQRGRAMRATTRTGLNSMTSHSIFHCFIRPRAPRRCTHPLPHARRTTSRFRGIDSSQRQTMSSNSRRSDHSQAPQHNLRPSMYVATGRATASSARSARDRAASDAVAGQAAATTRCPRLR